MRSAMTSSQPPVIYRTVIAPAWIDRNRHFNAGYYMVAFDEAVTGWFDYCGMGTEHRDSQRVATFTVEAIPTEFASSEYSRFLVYVEKARYVPLRTRYWDEAGVEVKEMRVEYDSIELHKRVWLPMRLTMRHLLHDTSTSLEVTHLEANPELPRATFALQRLESH